MEHSTVLHLFEVLSQLFKHSIGGDESQASFQTILIAGFTGMEKRLLMPHNVGQKPFVFYRSLTDRSF